MGFTLYLLMKIMPSINVAMLFVFVPLGMLVYGAVLYFTGEIKDEVSQVISKAKRFRYLK